MPGRLFLRTPIDDLARRSGVGTSLEPDPERMNIAPGQEVFCLTPDGWTRMRWGIVPVGRVNARGRPVMETIINARSETVFDKSAFAGTGRGVVPADGWYEWTGAKRRKTAWSLANADGTPLWFAAITDAWTAPGGQVVDQVATVTCPPTPQVADIHHRMGVLLTPDQIDIWLHGAQQDAAALMQPYVGELKIGKAAGVNWDAP